MLFNFLFAQLLSESWLNQIDQLFPVNIISHLLVIQQGCHPLKIPILFLGDSNDSLYYLL